MSSKDLPKGESKAAEQPGYEVENELPPRLKKEFEKLEEVFTVDTPMLKKITKRFGEELEAGLQADGQNIPMNITWVTDLPSGNEAGTFLTLDLGGTNLRVCWIVLTSSQGETKVTQDQFKLPTDLKSGSAEQLWDFIADSLQKFLEKHKLEGDEKHPIPLGFTFSYPATQEYIDHGILQTWTKGFDINGVEGEDVASQLRDAIKKRDLPISLTALINDTVGALIASMYNDPDTIIGAIFGTGCNAAYVEQCSKITKLKKQLEKTKEPAPEDVVMAINCEYGAFDNSHSVLPRTKYDKEIDDESPRPGEQAFEKMSAGLYLGEIFRLIVFDLRDRGVLFESDSGKEVGGSSESKLNEPYAIDTGVLSKIENDDSSSLQDTKSLFQDITGVQLTTQEALFLQHIANLIATRGARLCACGVSAICLRKGVKEGNVAADGSVANKHPHFKRRWEGAVREILDLGETDGGIKLTSAEDGSGVGAAVIVALTMERAKMGKTWGIREGSGRYKDSEQGLAGR